MQTDQKFILGVGIDNITQTEAIDAILHMIETYKQDRKSRYIATVNVDYLVNALSWKWPDVYNSELLNQLRNSSLDLCDGVPLRWFSYACSSPLKERIAGATLIGPLVKALAEKKYSVYLLGGTENEAQGAAQALKLASEDLRIAGITTPRIYTEGPELLDEPERDALLVEAINNANPDLLLLNLGNPKQELWFARIAQQLRVPVTIGIGGTFAFLSGSIPRAPQWMQKYGLEWAYRLYQEPKRLWKRYFLGIPQAFDMAVPTIIYHQICNGLYHLIYKHIKPNIPELQTRLYLSSTRSIAILELPTYLNTPSSTVNSEKIDQAFTHDHIVVDFNYVRHITLEGIAFLVKLWKRAQKEEKELSGLSLSGDMRLLLKMHRAWDILSAHQHKTVRDLMTTLQQARYNTLYDTITQDSKTVHISFFGKLDNDQDYERIFSRFEPIVKERDCTVDLFYCTTVESCGLSFLLRLQQYVKQHKHELKISCLHDELKKEFERAQLTKQFAITSCRPI